MPLNRRALIATSLAFAASPAFARAGFEAWLNTFRRKAASAGISERTLNAALNGVQFLPKVVANDSRQAEVAKPGRKSVSIVLDDLANSGLPGVAAFLERWQAKEVYKRASDDLFFFGQPNAEGLELFDIATGETVAVVGPKEAKQIKPNGGVRKLLGAALVQFQLSDPDIARRSAAVDAIAQNPLPEQLEPLRAAIDNDPDPALRERKARLAGLLTARFSSNTQERIAAIDTLSTGLSLDIRAIMNQLLTTTAGVAPQLPENVNIAQVLSPGTDLSNDVEYLTASARQPLGNHPDQQLTFERNAQGQFISAEALPTARWIVRLQIVDGADEWRREDTL